MIVKIASTFLDDGAEPGRIFVMDEPTAALTAREAERLFEIIAALKRRGCGVLYVSHRIEEILQDLRPDHGLARRRVAAAESQARRRPAPR